MSLYRSHSALHPPTGQEPPAAPVGPRRPRRPGPLARLPLHAELYLLAHEEYTGAPRLHRSQLSAGLAGAVLLDQWFAGRVSIGEQPHPGGRGQLPAPGRLDLVQHPGSPAVPDRVAPSAIAAVRRGSPTSPDQLRAWIHDYAQNVHHIIAGALRDAGVLHQTTVHRYVLLRTHALTATEQSWAVRATARIRNATNGAEQPDAGCVALAGLISVLELTDILHADIPDTDLRSWLRELAAQRHPAIDQVLTAVDAARGDLAVAAMS